MECPAQPFDIKWLGGWMDRWMDRFIDPMHTEENLYITEEN